MARSSGPAATRLRRLRHCFTCGKDIAAASRISAGLVGAGFAVLRFDFTGLGSSEGEFADTTFTSNVADLVAAAAMLRDRHEAPSLLVGHSLGGAAVLAAASQIPEVVAVATIAAPSDPAHAAGLISAEEHRRVDRDGEAEVTLAGRPFRLHPEFLEDNLPMTEVDRAVAAGETGGFIKLMARPSPGPEGSRRGPPPRRDGSGDRGRRTACSPWSSSRRSSHSSLDLAVLAGLIALVLLGPGQAAVDRVIDLERDELATVS